MESSPQIDCPIDLFPKQEEKIRDLTQGINEAKRIRQKAELARALLAEVEVLLRCSAYDEGNGSCVSCQAISGVLRRTATLILETEKALDRTFKAEDLFRGTGRKPRNRGGQVGGDDPSRGSGGRKGRKGDPPDSRGTP